jgi:Rrf2 family nitric oxide-sensitive transcriptional repressor
MRLTKFTGHAIRILIDCAQANGDLVKVATISNRLDITPQNAFKIANLLARAGFIKSVRGRNGGVKLSRPPAAIRIGDVVRATEVTHMEIEGALTGSREAGHGVNRVLDNALEAFIEVLDQHTIADMAKKNQVSMVAAKSGRRSKKPTTRSVATRTATRSRRTSI